jgi:hypothetical protein
MAACGEDALVILVAEQLVGDVAHMDVRAFQEEVNAAAEAAAARAEQLTRARPKPSSARSPASWRRSRTARTPRH